MINYMVEIIYSEKISEVENMLKIENIQYEFTSRDGFIFLVFMRWQTHIDLRLYVQMKKFDLKEYNR